MPPAQAICLHAQIILVLTLADAKECLDVALWHLLKSLGRPAKSCRCPLHPNCNASFFIYVGKHGGLR